MARGKKKETLTPGDRLQAALVPESEQPYPVPGNWCWVYWGVCGDFQAGSAFKNEYQGLTEYKIPFYKVGSLKYSDSNGILYDTSNTVNEEVRIKLKAALIPKNSIIFAKIGEAIRLNRRSINPVPCCIDNNLMSFHAKVCLTKYVYFWSLGIDLYNYTNATTVPAIRKSDLEKVAFPLAPSAEQQRIVDRIESLFAKLDEAKQKAQDALDSVETRKAAILHKAFTGELTAQWRKEHGVGMESWEKVSLVDVCILRSGTTIPVEHELSKGIIPYVKVADMNLPENYLTITTSSRFVNSCVDSHIIPYGSTIFPKRGGAILTNKKRFIAVPGIIADLNIMAIIPNIELINNWYCYYWMLSIDLRELNNGSNVPQINNKDMVKLNIPKPSLLEQSEIVRILEDLLSKEQQAKEATEGVVEQIDLIKKAILARAFRGKLGTNDPSEESAVELIKQVL